MPSRSRSMLVAIVVAVLAAACGSDEPEPSTTVAAAPATTVAPTTTASSHPTTTTSPPSTTTVTTAPGTVGDPVALRQAFAEKQEELAKWISYKPPVPVPDMTNLDPVVALEEIFLFEVWMLENGPYPYWADLFAYVDGPRNGTAHTQYGKLALASSRYVGVSETYEFLHGEVVPLEQSRFDGPDELEKLPEGAVAVYFQDRGGPYPEVNHETGEVYQRIGRWEAEGIVVLVPTDLGWVVYDEDRDEVYLDE